MEKISRNHWLYNCLFFVRGEVKKYRKKEGGKREKKEKNMLKSYRKREVQG